MVVNMNTLTKGNYVSKELVSRQFTEQNLAKFAPSSLVRMINRKLTERKFNVISKRKWLFFKQTYIKLELVSSNNFWDFINHKKLEGEGQLNISLPEMAICTYLEYSGLNDYEISIESYTLTVIGAENSGKLYKEYKLTLLLQPNT